MASVTAPNHNNVPLTPSACTRLRNKAFAPNEPLVVSVSAWTPISSSNTKHKAILMDDMDTRLPCVFNLPLENASNSQPSMVKLTAYSWKTVKTADQNDKEILIVDKAEIATEGTGASSDEQKENNNSNEPAAKRVKAEAGNAVAAETAPANKTTHAETKAEPSAPAAAAVAPKAAAAAPKANPNVRRKIISAEGLSPYMSSGTLKLRVTSKRPIRTVNTRVGEKDVLNVELAEAGTGFSIEATAWGDNARKFDEVLVEGRTFYVTKMRVALASKKYKSTDSDYTLGLENDTVIEALSDDEEAELVASEGDPNVAIVKAMAGVNISDIAVKMAKNPRMLVDVFGVVTEVGAVRSVKRKSDGSELQTREVTIVDDTGKSVNCALWGELVDKECAEMEAELAAKPDSALLVALRHVRPTSWNGVSLSSLSKSKVVLNPDVLVADCARASGLRRWYEQDGGKQTAFVAAGEGLSGALTAGGSPGGDGLTPEQRANDRKSFDALKVDNPEDRSLAEKEYANVRATVVYIKPDQNLMYLAAPDGSNKKVMDNGDGSFWCEGLGKSFTSATNRFIFSAKAVDSFGSETWLNMFNAEGEALFGKTADEMAAMEKEDRERCIKGAFWQSGVFRLCRQLREWQGERKVRVNTLSMSKIDYAAESRLLLAAIKSGC
ncbi:replication factor A1 [Pseudoscourfieldia marina]